MIKKAYIFTYDISHSMENMHNVIVFLHNAGSISNWAKYHSNSYIFISHLGASDLNKLISERVSEVAKKYFIVEANLNNNNGWLTSEIWEWIAKQKVNINPPFSL